MLRRFVICLLLLLAFSSAAFAQQSFTACFTASVGVPYTCDLGQLFGLTELASIFSSFDTQGETVVFTFSFALAPASNELPGVTISPDGVLSGTPTAPGRFTINVQLTEKLTLNDQDLIPATPFSIPLPIFVQGTAQGETIVDPGGLAFSFNQGDTSPSTQIITISNRSSQAITFTAGASVDAGTNWLSVSPSSGAAGPFAVASVVATVNPSGLPAGTYPGNISIAIAGGKRFSIPVVVTVTGTQGGVTVSQSGLLFRAVQGGGAPPSQSIEVLNTASGTVSFSASATTLTGGGWLSVSPASGTTSSSSAGSVTISINQAGLAPGTYYGEVDITSQGSSSPEIVSVVLNIFTPAQSPGPSLSTFALIFVAEAGGSNPAAQNVVATNPSPNPVTFVTTLFSDTGSSVFFTEQPPSGTINSSPVPISVQPVITGLAPGVYIGELALTFSVTPTVAIQSRVAIVLVVTPSFGGTAGGLSSAPLASSCTPTKLIPVSTGLGNLFQVSAGWPQSLEVTVVDDCGVKLTTGSVVATFSSGDPALPLTSLNDGRWTATWNPQSGSGSEVTITVQAQQVKPALLGSARLGGTLLANASVPIVSANGVDSAVSNVPHQPIGPGSFINIYGSALSQGTNTSKLPFAQELGGTKAMLGGKVLPLFFTSTGRIIAIVPFDVPVNTTKQLVVFLNGAISVPVPVVLSTAQPAIFTRDTTGTGLGVIFGYKSKAHGGGAPFLVDDAHPVSAGDTLAIYATGLGPVDQPVAAGSAGPSSPLAHTVNPVTATIGGKAATVAFAGLVPGAVVYQVNAVVPQGVTPGNSVPIVLSTAGLQSTPVTIVVK